MRDPLPIIQMLGCRFDRERTGWRDRKALVKWLAEHPGGGWDVAADLADLLGLDPEQQENIYREVTDGARDHARVQTAQPAQPRALAVA